MLQFLKKNGWFYIPYLAFLLIAGTFLIIFKKNDVHYFLNGLHFSLGDEFFKRATHLGDGLTLGIFIFLLLFVKYRHAIIMIFSTISVTIVVQAFKRYILPDIDRPKIAFFNKEELYFVPGIHIHTSHSFPSGHSATAFSIFLFLALVTKNNYLKLLYFFLAFLVAYSRVYLSQHFLNDIYFGSLIAVILTSISYAWVVKWKNNKLDLSLLNIFRSNKNDNQ